MKLMLLGDVHIADANRAPSIRTPDYPYQIGEKVRAAGRIAVEQNCDAIIQLGDWFHYKQGSHNSHWLVQYSHDILTESGLPVIIVAGNHDIVGNRHEDLDRQPLGTLGRLPGIELLDGAHSQYPIWAIPYTEKKEIVQHSLMLMENWTKERRKKDPNFYPLVISHVSLFPDHENPPYPHWKSAQWANWQKVGDLAYGHIHTPFGEWKVGDVHFGNFGSISRGSLHEETLKRKPQVAIWEPAGSSHFTPFELPYLPAKEVFRLAEKEDADERKERVSTFLQSVDEVVLDGLTLEEVLHHAESQDLKPGTMDAIREVVEHALANR